MAETTNAYSEARVEFQSLKGFQRFCGGDDETAIAVRFAVSIPKRVSEVLWLFIACVKVWINPSFNP